LSICVTKDHDLDCLELGIPQLILRIAAPRRWCDGRHTDKGARMLFFRDVIPSQRGIGIPNGTYGTTVYADHAVNLPSL